MKALSEESKEDLDEAIEDFREREKIEHGFTPADPLDEIDIDVGVKYGQSANTEARPDSVDTRRRFLVLGERTTPMSVDLRVPGVPVDLT